jgi:hypothetical protein
VARSSVVPPVARLAAREVSFPVQQRGHDHRKSNIASSPPFLPLPSQPNAHRSSQLRWPPRPRRPSRWSRTAPPTSTQRPVPQRRRSRWRRARRPTRRRRAVRRTPRRASRRRTRRPAWLRPASVQPDGEHEPRTARKPRTGTLRVSFRPLDVSVGYVRWMRPSGMRPSGMRPSGLCPSGMCVGYVR